MPFITWINEIFPESQAPYEMTEIVQRLQTFWNSEVSADAVYRARIWLRDQTPLKEVVKPVNPDGSPHLYSAEAARRIGRRIATLKPLTCPFSVLGEAKTDPFEDLKKSAIQARAIRLFPREAQ